MRDDAFGFMDLPDDIRINVLRRLGVDDIARVAATCNGIQLNAVSVLRRRIEEQHQITAWRSRQNERFRPTIDEMDLNDSGFVNQAMYLAWFLRIRRMLESHVADHRMRALESLGRNPSARRRYADVLVQIALRGENMGVKNKAFQARMM